MDAFVGAEYLIANALIELEKKGIERIRVSQLHRLGIKVQERCLQENIFAVFLISNENIETAIYNFSDYFMYDASGDEPVISIKKDSTIDKLERRFVGYLSPSVLRVIITSAKESLAS